MYWVAVVIALPPNHNKRSQIINKLGVEDHESLSKLGVEDSYAPT